MMAEKAEDVKQKDVIIVPSPRCPLRRLEDSCGSGPEGTGCRHAQGFGT